MTTDDTVPFDAWEKGLVVMVGAAAFLACLFFLRTPAWKLSWDAGGHLQHVEMVAEGTLLPLSKACWQCYHPPLYYLAAGAFAWVVKVRGAAMNQPLQLFALAFHLCFLTLAVGWIRRSHMVPGARLLAGAFAIFWPSGLMHSIRIGNDGLVYLAHVAALLLLTRHLEDRANGSLAYAAAGMAAAATLVKANGLVTMAIVGTALLMRHGPRARVVWRAAAISAAGVASLLVIIHLKGDVLTNSGGLSRTLVVDNKVENFLAVDLGNYFKPFCSGHEDEGGRQSVPTFLVKSSLFGEFVSQDRWARRGAVACNVLMIVVLPLAIYGMALGRRRPDRLVHLLNIGWCVLALYVYRAKLPFACSGDFRYIYPVIISAGVFYADALFGLMRRTGRRSVLAAGVGFLVALLVTGNFVLFRF